jgi:hypothetical protein
MTDQILTPVPAGTVYEPTGNLVITDPDPNLPEGVTQDQFVACVKYYWDYKVNQHINSLSDTELTAFFEMFTGYSAILKNVCLIKGEPLSNYVLYGNEFYEALRDHHEGIDFTSSWIVVKYKEWLTTKGLPLPEDKTLTDGIDLSPLLAWQTAHPQ